MVRLGDLAPQDCIRLIKSKSSNHICLDRRVVAQPSDSDGRMTHTLDKPQKCHLRSRSNLICTFFIFQLNYSICWWMRWLSKSANMYSLPIVLYVIMGNNNTLRDIMHSVLSRSISQSLSWHGSSFWQCERSAASDWETLHLIFSWYKFTCVNVSNITFHVCANQILLDKHSRIKLSSSTGNRLYSSLCYISSENR